MAFYRPFHFPPFNQWGIYLLLDKMVAYHKALSKVFHNRVPFGPVTLMHFILFEVFRHEFFHHLVESTATTIEIVLAASQHRRPVYLEYWHRQFQGILPTHPHEPLEEALANAYAYNSLAFMSRIKTGFKTLAVKAYQTSLQGCWPTEPPGYREAGNYIEGGQVAGAAHLLAMLLQEPSRGNDIPLMKLAEAVMPAGFTAFCSKPEIPTCFVGKPDIVEVFMQLVPVPVDAFTSLFLPLDTKEYDAYIRKKSLDHLSISSHYVMPIPSVLAFQATP